MTLAIRELYPLGLGKPLHLILKSLNILSQPLGDLDAGPRYLSGWYCAQALSYFKDLKSDIDHRKEIVKIYTDNLDKSLQLSSDFQIRFPIIASERDELIKELSKNGVYVSDIWYEAPVSPRKYLEETSYSGECPVAEKISQKILNLPTHKHVGTKDAMRISSIIMPRMGIIWL